MEVWNKTNVGMEMEQRHDKRTMEALKLRRSSLASQLLVTLGFNGAH